jgi:hypothetical protein
VSVSACSSQRYIYVRKTHQKDPTDSPVALSKQSRLQTDTLGDGLQLTVRRSSAVDVEGSTQTGSGGFDIQGWSQRYGWRSHQARCCQFFLELSNTEPQQPWLLVWRGHLASRRGWACPTRWPAGEGRGTGVRCSGTGQHALGVVEDTLPNPILEGDRLVNILINARPALGAQTVAAGLFTIASYLPFATQETQYHRTSAPLHFGCRACRDGGT